MILPLLLGLFFYLLFREKLPAAFPDTGLALSPLPSKVQASLPNGLWSFSLAVCLMLIWKKSGKMALLGCALASVLTAFLFEFLQLTQPIGGTFDWNDVLFSVAGSLLAALFFQKFLYYD